MLSPGHVQERQVHIGARSPRVQRGNYDRAGEDKESARYLRRHTGKRCTGKIWREPRWRYHCESFLEVPTGELKSLELPITLTKKQGSITEVTKDTAIYAMQARVASRQARQECLPILFCLSLSMVQDAVRNGPAESDNSWT